MNTHHPILSRKFAALTLLTALSLSSISLTRAEEAKKAAPAAALTPHLFGGQVAEAVHLTATVEKINYETREVTLKGEQGALKTIVAGPEVKRLAEIHQGDTIELVYGLSVMVLAGDSAGAPARDDSAEVMRAEKSEKPGAAAIVRSRVLATVTAMDLKARTATVKGPEQTMTINVPTEFVNFEKVKVGDSVYLEITQAIAVAVTKSAPVPAK